MKSYYFYSPKDNEAKHRILATLKEQGFNTPELLADNVFYVATDGEVVGFSLFDKRAEAMAAFIKRHQEITEFHIERRVPLFNNGDYIKHKVTGTILSVLEYVESCKCYVCKEYYHKGLHALPVDAENDWEVLCKTQQFTTGQIIKDKQGNEFYIHMVDTTKNEYVCKSCGRIGNVYRIPFIRQSWFTLVPRLSVGQFVINMNMADGCFFEVKEVLDDGYKVIGNDGKELVFPIEDELVPIKRPKLADGDVVAYEEKLSRVSRMLYMDGV